MRNNKGQFVGPQPNAYTVGHTVSDEVRKKMSLAAKKLASKPGYINPATLPGVGDKISKAKTGEKRSEEARLKYHIKMLKYWHGDNWDKVYFTKRQIAQQIRHSREYNEWRIEVLKRDNYICFVCGERGGKLEAHHIKPFANYPELRFDINNGQTVHKKCHNHSGWKYTNIIYKNPDWGNTI